MDGEKPWSGTIPSLKQLLSDELIGASRFLEEVRLEIRAPNFPDSPLDLTDCQAINGILSRYPNLRRFSLVLVSSETYSYPIILEEASVKDIVAYYDITPLSDHECSAIKVPSKPADCTVKEWVDELTKQAETILQSRLQTQFGSLDNCILDVQLSIKLWLEDEWDAYYGARNY